MYMSTYCYLRYTCINVGSLLLKYLCNPGESITLHWDITHSTGLH